MSIKDCLQRYLRFIEIKEEFELASYKKVDYGCLSLFLVEIPKGRYNGQKLIKPVSIKMPDAMSNPIAMGPVITLKMYKTLTLLTHIPN